MNFPKGTLVRVRWVDILSKVDWHSEDTLDAPPIVETVGFFIANKTYHTLSCIVVAGSRQDEEISNTDIIPEGVIISIENLDE